MKGLYFLAIAPGANAGQSNIMTGVIESEVAPGKYLLAFDGRNFGFKRIVTVDGFNAYSFFESRDDQQSAVQELLARNPAATEDAPNH